LALIYWKWHSAVASENVPDLLIRCDFSPLDLCCQAPRKEKPFRRSLDCSFLPRLLALSRWTKRPKRPKVLGCPPQA